jgi:hypothetical protein
MPRALRNKGITGWPKIVLLGRNEPVPAIGVPYLRASKQDYALTFRLMVPLLEQSNPQFNWKRIYYELTGRKYKPAELFYRTNSEVDNSTGSSYYNSIERTEETTLAELASDTASALDLNTLMELKMLPTFMSNIAEAIKVNVTNNFAWQDGYNKKTKLCTGSLVEQPRKKSLVILDISWSIPEAVSAGMMTLIQTITDITHADLILTGAKSYFYTNDEVKAMDIHAERKRIPRNNESEMFREILKTHDMNYENVIVFGDSDNPGSIEVNASDVKKFYSFFVGKRDRYNRSYTSCAGYGRWIIDNNPNAQVIHNTNWAKLFV